MKALSIRQPWAWLIVRGYKNLENRTWRLPDSMVGQRIVVHAGLKMGWGPGDAWIMERLTPGQLADFKHMRDLVGFKRGALVGEVDIIGHYQPARTELFQGTEKWYMGPEAFILSAATPYLESIPYSGHLGFFNIPEGVLA